MSKESEQEEHEGVLAVIEYVTPGKPTLRRVITEYIDHLLVSREELKADVRRLESNFDRLRTASLGHGRKAFVAGHACIPYWDYDEWVNGQIPNPMEDQRPPLLTQLTHPENVSKNEEEINKSDEEREDPYEYQTTKGPRKAWDGDPDLSKEGWEEIDFERFEYHEERRWRRLKTKELGEG